MNGTQIAPRTSAGSSGDQERQVGPGAAAAASARPHVFDLVGGTRGAIDGGPTPLVFVVVNATAGANTTRSTALTAAIGAALATGLAIVALRSGAGRHRCATDLGVYGSPWMIPTSGRPTAAEAAKTTA